jgi:hypothetical protein
VAWRSLVGAVAAAVTACAIALAAALFPAVSVRAVGIPDAPQVPVEHLPASFVAAASRRCCVPGSSGLRTPSRMATGRQICAERGVSASAPTRRRPARGRADR